MIEIRFAEKFVQIEKNKNISIYGTGVAGKIVYKALEKMKIDIQFFLDGDVQKIGKSFCGKEIVGENSLSKDSIVLIAANPVYEIHNRLERAGIQEWCYVDPVWFDLYSEGVDHVKTTHLLEENKDKLLFVYNMLADNQSKVVFQSVLKHRLVHDLSLLDMINNSTQYFGNDVIHSISGTFVECGAFTGDTLERFIKQTGGGYMYHAFEADKQNCNEIIAFCNKNNNKNVLVYNMAVCDRNREVLFWQDENDYKVNGIVDVTNKCFDKTMVNKIQGDSLDNVLCNAKIDMIAMDIEGAELYALKGARSCIETWKPKLAISAYHTIEHMWEIPLMIKEMYSDYQIYFRHHSWNINDTVCYAIKSE